MSAFIRDLDNQKADRWPGSRLKPEAREIRDRLDEVDFGREDTAKLSSLGGLMACNAGHFADSFFDHLARRGGVSGLTHNPARLARARRLKIRHLRAMTAGHYGDSYVDERLKMSRLYSRAGMSPRAFLGAFNHLLGTVCSLVVAEGGTGGAGCMDAFRSFHKIAFFDIGLSIDTLVREREERITLQHQAGRGLPMPILMLGDGLLVVPLVGVLDEARVSLLTSRLLAAVQKGRAKAVVIDVTGVLGMDGKTIRHLNGVAQAARLMGTRAVLTGLAPAACQSWVNDGVGPKNLGTYHTLCEGVEAVRAPRRI